MKLFKHQIEGIAKLCAKPAFAIFDEMGCGKSAQVINAACQLYPRVNTVVVVCPASVRTVWCDETFGEIKKHAWIPSAVFEFALGKLKTRWSDDAPVLRWVVTNYEILRTDKHLQFLIGQLKLADSNTMLVLDESSYVKSRTAKQTKAVLKLRAVCDRVVILNGTPIYHSPLDLWSQFNILEAGILPSSFWAFRAEHCEMIPQKYGHGPTFQKIVKYKNLDKLSKRLAPHVLRRLKKDCLDLPPKLYTVREVALSTESWARYQQLKKDALVVLSGDDVRLEPNAAVRILRLCQLTSGHLGQQMHMMTDGSKEAEANALQHLASGCAYTEDLPSEKLDWMVNYLTTECTARYVIVWCRWRRERERLVDMLAGRSIYVYQIYGGQSQKDRDWAVKGFSLGDSEFPENKCVCVAQPHAGGLGLNLVAATEEWFLSNDWSYGMRLQAEDRAHRPGQLHPVTIGDVLATGPAGQKTVDHAVFQALRDKDDLAAWTTARWRSELGQESSK